MMNQEQVVMTQQGGAGVLHRIGMWVVLWIPALIFWLVSMRASAATVAYFTHIHGDACLQNVEHRCGGMSQTGHNHYEITYACRNCGNDTKQIVDEDFHTCPIHDITGYYNGSRTCKVCGTVSGTWNTYGIKCPGVYTVEEIACGIEEGEPVAAVSISFDDSPTNVEVVLTAHVEMLKGDLTIGVITPEWTTKSVSENGEYTLGFADAMGRSTTVSAMVSCIDKEAPVITGIRSDESTMTARSIEFQVSASDGQSGLPEDAYSYDGGSTWTSSSAYTVTEGTPVTVVVRDLAGNRVSKTVKRSDFPYPPAPEPEKPASGGTGGQSAAANSGTGNNGTNGSESSNRQESGSGSGSTPGSNTGAGNGTGAGGAAADRGDNSSSASGSGSNHGGNSSGSRTGNGSDVLSDSTEKENADAEADDEEFAEMTEELANTEDGEGASFGYLPIISRMDENENDGNPANDSPEEEAAESQEESAGDTNIVQGTAGKKAAGSEFLKRIREIGWGVPVGGGMCFLALGLLIRMIWLQSAVLYLYDGGDEYRKIALMKIRKSSDGYEIIVPEHLSESNKPRYRLMFRKSFVKKEKNKQIRVCLGEHEIQKPIEECMDFIF